MAAPNAARLLVLVPALLFLGFHLRTLDYGFVWTDEIEIVDRGIVLPVGELHQAFTRPMVADVARAKSWAYYRPLQVMTVSVIHAWAGEKPRAYRLPSLLFGAATMSLFAGLNLARGHPLGLPKGMRWGKEEALSRPFRRQQPESQPGQQHCLPGLQEDVG